MKRTTIGIISFIIGVSFVGLLYLQARNIRAMVKMRKEQFDESVFRALDQTSRDIERNETFRYLETVAEQSGYEADNLEASLTEEQIQATLALGDTLSGITPFRLQTQTVHPSQLPKGLVLRPSTSLDAASLRFQEFVKNAYLYQKGVLDEVIMVVGVDVLGPALFQPVPWLWRQALAWHPRIRPSQVLQ